MTPEEQAASDAAAAAKAAAAFDPAAFATTLMAEVTKAIAASQKSMKAEFAKLIKPPADPAAEAAAAAAAAEAAAEAAGKPRDPQVAALERSNRELVDRFKALEEKNRQTEEANKQTNARAEEKERHAAIRASLGDYQFASDDAREDAFRALRDEVKRGEDGELYGGDFVPAKDFIKTRMAVKTHLLATKQVDSAGARQHAGGAGAPRVQIEDIKPGMDPKVRESAWAAVNEANRMGTN